MHSTLCDEHLKIVLKLTGPALFVYVTSFHVASPLVRLSDKCDPEGMCTNTTERIIS